ncbi:MAG: hypothetical protein ACE5KM_22560 [Planctomycetaceae bacterium]
MNKVIVDEELRTRLQNLDVQIEFCDETGATLGYFRPVSAEERDVYDWAKRAFSDEEIEAARNEEGGLTTQELLEHLKSL